MLLFETIRSSTFKLALVCIGIFGAIVAGLFAYVDWVTETYVLGRFDRGIEAEHQLLMKSSGGERDGLARQIRERMAEHRFLGGVYLLVDAAHQPIAGHLDAWPDALAKTDGWADFRASDPARGPQRGPFLRAKVASLRDGSRLLVGADIDDLVHFDKKIDLALAATIVLVLVLAGVSGLTVTRRTVGRIDAINRTSRLIMDSGLGRRIPLRGTHDEWDQLAGNLNSMLERIETLLGEVRQVTDNIAHDLRTPLGRMRARLETAARRPRAAAPDEELIADTLRDLDNVLAMFASLLRITHVETRDRQSAFREIDLAAIAREVAELFEPAVEIDGGRLVVLGDRQLLAMGDRDLLFDAISNLVDNALKHGPKASEITIEAADVGGERVVAVRDSGPGIPAAERDHVLRRFYRLERSRCTPGNGLGLSLVAAIAHLHGARLAMQDNRPGLTIRLVFPPYPVMPTASRAAAG